MIICDAHQDIYDALVGTRKGANQTDFDQVKQTLKIVQAAIFVPHREDGEKETTEFLRHSIIRQLAWYRSMIKNDPKFYLILNREDLEYVLKSNKTGVILHLEGAD